MPVNLLRKLRKRVAARGSEPAPDAEPHQPPAPASPAPASPRRQAGGGRARRRRPRRSAAPPTDNWTPEAFQVPPEEGLTRFHDLDLPPELLHAVADLEFRYCTPVQAKALPHALKGQNVAGRAQTGTGKTAAFLIAIFARLLRDPSRRPSQKAAPRALVLAPTRELVVQIVEDAAALTRYTDLRAVAVYGGMDFDKQRRQLEGAAVDLVAATPGRLLDFVGRRLLNLRHVDELVIDEADRMLDMGFIPDVRRIVRHLPPRHRRRSMLFSATLSDDVMRLAAQWVPDPVIIEVDPEQVAVDTVCQKVYAVPSCHKFKLLCRLLQREEFTRVLVFGNRRDSTQRLARRLKRHGVDCRLLSGDVPQKQRLGILNAFRGGEVRVLVATDVAGRGIHVDNISHVINYDFPYEAEDYVHRIGRTGRAGEEGTAISFACEDESFVIPEIEAFIGRPLPCIQPEPELTAALPPPSGPAEDIPAAPARPRRGRSRRSERRSSRGRSRRSR